MTYLWSYSMLEDSFRWERFSSYFCRKRGMAKQNILKRGLLCLYATINTKWNMNISKRFQTCYISQYPQAEVYKHQPCLKVFVPHRKDKFRGLTRIRKTERIKHFKMRRTRFVCIFHSSLNQNSIPVTTFMQCCFALYSLLCLVIINSQYML